HRHAVHSARNGGRSRRLRGEGGRVGAVAFVGDRAQRAVVCKQLNVVSARGQGVAVRILQPYGDGRAVVRRHRRLGRLHGGGRRSRLAPFPARRSSDLHRHAVHSARNGGRSRRLRGEGGRVGAV